MAAPAAGVLVVQLGTPDEPTAPALRRYLRQFLWDRRVIDLPRALWWPLLNLVVLPRRPARSAALYQRVWTPEGSPLLVTTRRQAEAVRAGLSNQFPELRVAVAMRYGSPSIEEGLNALGAGIDRLLIAPLYPQYAGATTGSSLEAVLDVLGSRRVVPAIRTLPPFFAASEYLDAVAGIARESLAGLDWTPDHYVVSFHGLPRRYADAGDPYPDHCAITASEIARRAGWPADAVTLAFQSRFGREEWLKPYADATLVSLARRGARVAVICPGFAADCLETLEEMNMTNRELFTHSGGTHYHYIPCLNAHARGLDALTAVIGRELEGWERAS